MTETEIYESILAELEELWIEDELDRLECSEAHREQSGGLYEY